jgi:phospholipid/cholesterol/gamma-HCH transport system substrate-binding protein
MENKSHAIAAGSFVLLLLALLTAMAVWLTRDSSAQRVYEVTSAEAVSGLQPQAYVRYKGVAAGRVTAIGLDPQERGHVLLRIAVNDDVPVTASTFASLGYQGVTGLAFVQLDDSGAEGAQLPTSNSRPARIPLRPGLVSRLSAQGGQILSQVQEASARINNLLSPERQQAMLDALNNLSQAAAGLGSLTRHADQMLTGSGPTGSASLPRVAAQAEATLRSLQGTVEGLKDSSVVINGAVGEFRRSAQRLNEPGGTLDQISVGIDALAAASANVNTGLLPRLARSSDEATRTARQLGHLAEGLSEQPQSLLLGRGAPAPGPGEAGFVPPTDR